MSVQFQLINNLSENVIFSKIKGVVNLMCKVYIMFWTVKLKDINVGIEQIKHVCRVLQNLSRVHYCFKVNKKYK